jgi:hypothetical protein
MPVSFHLVDKRKASAINNSNNNDNNSNNNNNNNSSINNNNNRNVLQEEEEEKDDYDGDDTAMDMDAAVASPSPEESYTESINVTATPGVKFGLTYIPSNETPGLEITGVAGTFSGQVGVGDVIVSMNVKADTTSINIIDNIQTERTLVIHQKRQNPPDVPEEFLLNPIVKVTIEKGTEPKFELRNMGGPIVVQRNLGPLKKGDVLLAIKHMFTYGKSVKKVKFLLSLGKEEDRTVIILRNRKTDNRLNKWSFGGFYLFIESSMDEFIYHNAIFDLEEIILKMWNTYTSLSSEVKTRMSSNFNANRLHMATLGKPSDVNISGQKAYYSCFKELFGIMYPDGCSHKQVTEHYNKLSSVDKSFWDDAADRLSATRKEILVVPTNSAAAEDITANLTIPDENDADPMVNENNNEDDGMLCFIYIHYMLLYISIFPI